MNITIRQMKVFREVALQKSFTQASKVLFLTQPAVSMQIKQLEASVGASLFEKQGRQIYLTDAGKEIHLCNDCANTKGITLKPFFALNDVIGSLIGEDELNDLF